MLYYNIHTHKSSSDREERAIVNIIVGNKDFEHLQAEACSKKNWYSAGIHPWYIYNVREQTEKLRLLLETTTLTAIGEAGLDKIADSPIREQEQVFELQAEMAETYQKPLIIHCVKAWQELIAIKKKIHPTMPWIIHGFRGNGQLAQQLITQGFDLSFGNHFNPSALQVAWPFHLFAETDESSVNIQTVYTQIATSLAVSEEELALQIESQLKSRIFVAIH